MSIGLILFILAGVVAAYEAFRTQSLLAVAISLLCFAHVFGGVLVE